MNKFLQYQNILIFTYDDGKVDKVVGDAASIRQRFVDYVSSVLPHYVDGLVSVALADNAGRVYKLYCNGLKGCCHASVC